MGGRGSGRPIGPMTDRMRRAAELGAQGKSYREIGEELGVGQQIDVAFAAMPAPGAPASAEDDADAAADQSFVSG